MLGCSKSLSMTVLRPSLRAFSIAFMHSFSTILVRTGMADAEVFMSAFCLIKPFTLLTTTRVSLIRSPFPSFFTHNKLLLFLHHFFFCPILVGNGGDYGF